jgi:hypothetical protein
MKSMTFVVLAAALAGCSVNSSAPVTAWGKKNVSLLDYRTDAGQCAVLAATHQTGENGANTAGGINGQNSGAPQSAPASGSATASAGGGSGGSTAQSISGGTYRENASADFVNRAAMQQRTQEMAEQRARSDALKACLTNRGYTEFEHTAAQRAELAKLPQGSDERRNYLYKLGTDADVLANQATRK